MTQSTTWAAVSHIRRPRQLGQKPRSLQDVEVPAGAEGSEPEGRATTISSPHFAQVSRQKPCASGRISAKAGGFLPGGGRVE
jgi:hypothetical protein